MRSAADAVRPDHGTAGRGRKPAPEPRVHADGLRNVRGARRTARGSLALAGAGLARLAPLACARRGRGRGQVLSPLGGALTERLMIRRGILLRVRCGRLTEL